MSLKMMSVGGRSLRCSMSVSAALALSRPPSQRTGGASIAWRTGHAIE